MPYEADMNLIKPSQISEITRRHRLVWDSSRVLRAHHFSARIGRLGINLRHHTLPDCHRVSGGALPETKDAGGPDTDRRPVGYSRLSGSRHCRPKD